MWTKDYTHPEKTYTSMDSAVGYYHARGFTQGLARGDSDQRIMWHPDGRRVTITNDGGKITAEERR